MAPFGLSLIHTQTHSRSFSLTLFGRSPTFPTCPHSFSILLTKTVSWLLTSNPVWSGTLKTCCSIIFLFDEYSFHSECELSSFCSIALCLIVAWGVQAGTEFSVKPCLSSTVLLRLNCWLLNELWKDTFYKLFTVSSLISSLFLSPCLLLLPTSSFLLFYHLTSSLLV